MTLATSATALPGKNDINSIIPERTASHSELAAASRTDAFKVFSPSDIISSLQRNPSLKLKEKRDTSHVANSGPGMTSSFMSDALQTELAQANGRIDILIMENDRLIQSNLKQSSEIESLTSQLNTSLKKEKQVVEEIEERNVELEGFKEFAQDQQENSKTLTKQLKLGSQELAEKEEQVQRLEEVVRKKDRENDELNLKLEDAIKELTDFTLRYKDVVQEATIASKREKDLLTALDAQSLKIEELEGRQSQQVRNTELAQKDLHNQEILNKSMQEKIETIEKRELELVEKSLKIAFDIEEAHYSRDTAINREQLLLKEIESLNQKCIDQPKIYKEKSDLKIQTLRSQFQSEKRKFINETQKLEDLCTSLQSQVERALRDKRSAESELEKMTRHIPAEADRLTMTIEELHSKLRASERERHEAVQKLESLHQKMHHQVNQYEMERHQSNERLEEYHRRIRRLEKETEDSKDESIKSHQTISTLESDKKSLLEQMRNTASAHETQLKVTCSKYESQIIDLTTKLESLSESHGAATRDLQRYISNQRSMGDKWKEESDEIKSHYEQIIKKLKLELGQYEKRVGELEKIVQKGSSQRKELFDQVTNEKKNFAMLHEKCVSLKKENEGLGREVAALLAKEVDLLEERKKIARQLDQLALEKEHRRKEGLKNSLRPRVRNIMAEIDQDLPLNDQKVTKKLEEDIERVQKRTGRKLMKMKSIDIDTGSD